MISRAVRLSLVVSTLATSLVLVSTVDDVAEPFVGDAPTAHALNTVNILFERAGNTPKFGPNELVEIFAGNINYIGGKIFTDDGPVDSCTLVPGTNTKRQHPGINDTLQPFADIYIVPASTGPTNNDALNDLGGAPNTVFGGLGRLSV